MKKEKKSKLNDRVNEFMESIYLEKYITKENILKLEPEEKFESKYKIKFY